MLNKVMLIGNLGADPEMRYTPNGAAVTEFGVASNRRYTGSDGEQVDETEWFNVVTWSRLAETCAQYLTKGRQVYVEGRLNTRSWDGECGKKHYRAEVVAFTVQFLGGRDGASPPAEPGLPVGADAEGDVDPDDLPF